MKDVISRYGNDLNTDVIVVLCECGDASHSIVVTHDKYDEEHKMFPREFCFMVTQAYGMGFWRRLKQAWRYLREGTYFCDASVIVPPTQVKELGQKLIELSDKDMVEYEKNHAKNG